MSAGRYIFRPRVFQPRVFALRALADSGIVPVLKYGRMIAAQVYRSGIVTGQAYQSGTVAAGVYQSGIEQGQVQ